MKRLKLPTVDTFQNVPLFGLLRLILARENAQRSTSPLGFGDLSSWCDYLEANLHV